MEVGEMTFQEDCLVAQGYRFFLFKIFLLIYGSGFTAIQIIKEIEGEVK